MIKISDLDGYFDRIEWGASISPTFETLSGLLQAHISHIPFENFDIFTGQPIRLDLDWLYQKMVINRRGGYCFEHARLFSSVLKSLGFAVQEHSARITRVQPRSEAHRDICLPLLK